MCMKTILDFDWHGTRNILYSPLSVQSVLIVPMQHMVTLLPVIV